MFNIIRDIFSHESLQHLALKGGTLCYFIHGLDRYSTDIDIDCVDGAVLPEHKLAIENILLKYGKIKDSQSFQNMQRYVLSYGEQDHNIKIELNGRIWRNNRYEIVNFFGMSIRAMDKASVFSNKLVALSDRSSIASRDMWDILFFFKKVFPLNPEIITERTGKATTTFLVDTIQFIKSNFNSANIVDGNLGVVLDEKQKARAITHLIQEVVQNLEFLVFNISKNN